MPAFAAERMRKCIADTSHCTGLTLVLALSYSARWEIVMAARELARLAADGKIKPEEINEEIFAGHLATADMPDPDLLIRTGGDMRVSNYLLYQIAYTELIVNPTYWPDYSRENFRDDIAIFQQRQRRFGKTGEQVTDNENNK